MLKNTVCASTILAAAMFAGVRTAQADVLAGNFWPNPTLEEASATRDNSPSLGANGTWRRGGVDYNQTGAASTVDFWDNSHGTVSGTHALVLNDNTTTTNGEWFVPDFDTDASVVPVTVGASGQQVEFHFLWNYNTTIPAGNPNGADMRVTIRGTDGTSSFGLYDFLANGNTNNQFIVADFIRTLPAGTTGLRMNIASGGDAAVTGFLAVDDISVRYVPEPTTAMGVFGLGGLLLRRKTR